MHMAGKKSSPQAKSHSQLEVPATHEVAAGVRNRSELEQILGKSSHGAGSMGST